MPIDVWYYDKWVMPDARICQFVAALMKAGLRNTVYVGDHHRSIYDLMMAGF